MGADSRYHCLGSSQHSWLGPDLRLRSLELAAIKSSKTCRYSGSKEASGGIKTDAEAKTAQAGICARPCSGKEHPALGSAPWSSVSDNKPSLRTSPSFAPVEPRILSKDFMIPDSLHSMKSRKMS